MKMKDPPRIASWMLEHLAFGSRNEALAGDLLEEFRRGRSVAWYWGQALVAIAIGLRSLLRAQRLAICYAILWTIPVHAFDVLVARRAAALPLFAHRWQLEWPYSTGYDMLLFFGLHFLYIGFALLLYFGLFSLDTGIFNWSQLRKSLWIAGFVVAIIRITEFAVFALLPRHAVYTIAGHVTVLQLITGAFFWADRLPVFFNLLVPILMAFPRVEKVTRAAT